MRQDCEDARSMVFRQNNRIEDLDQKIGHNENRQQSILENLKDMKKLFMDTIKESQDMNMKSQDLTLSTKQEVMIKIGNAET